MASPSVSNVSFGRGWQYGASMTSENRVHSRLFFVATSAALIPLLFGSVRAAWSAEGTVAPAGSSFSVEMTRFAVELFTETIGKPGGSVLDARAARIHWSAAPPDLRGLFNTKAGYITQMRGHRVFIGHDGARGMVVVGTWDGFNVGEAKAELSKTYQLKAFNSVPAGDMVLEDYWATRGGAEVAMIGIFHDVSATGRGNGVLLLVPSSRARLEEAEGPKR